MQTDRQTDRSCHKTFFCGGVSHAAGVAVVSQMNFVETMLCLKWYMRLFIIN